MISSKHSQYEIVKLAVNFIFSFECLEAPATQVQEEVLNNFCGVSVSKKINK